MQWKKPAGSTLASTTRLPPRTDSPQRARNTRPSSFGTSHKYYDLEKELYLSANACQVTARGESHGHAAEAPQKGRPHLGCITRVMGAPDPRLPPFFPKIGWPGQPPPRLP